MCNENCKDTCNCNNEEMRELTPEELQDMEDEFFYEPDMEALEVAKKCGEFDCSESLRDIYIGETGITNQTELNAELAQKICFWLLQRHIPKEHAERPDTREGYYMGIFNTCSKFWHENYKEVKQ